MIFNQKVNCEVCKKEILYVNSHLPIDEDGNDHVTCGDCCWECSEGKTIPDEEIELGTDKVTGEPVTITRYISVEYSNEHYGGKS